MATVEQLAAMETISDGVVDALAQAQAHVSVTWSWGDAKAQQLDALASIAQQVEKLIGPWRSYVQGGAWTFDKWAQLAKEHWNVIRSIDSDIGSWNFSGLVSSALSQTFSDVKELGQKTGEVLSWGIPAAAIYVLVVLVLLVVLRVA